MLAGLARSLLLAGGGVVGGLGIVAAVYGPGDLMNSVRSRLAPEPPAVTAPEQPEWGERNVDLGRGLLPADPRAAPTAERQAGEPSLDIVRVEPSGDAVIAGRGAPNATVEILRDNKPYASGIADETGQFAIVPPALPTGNSELTYRTTAKDGTQVSGRENIVVVVPDRPDTKPLVAVGTPDRPTQVLSQPDAPAMAAAEPRTPDGTATTGKPEETTAAKLDSKRWDLANPDSAKPDPAKAARPPERMAALPDSAPKPTPANPANGNATPGKPGPAAGKQPDLKIVSVDAQEGGRLDISGRATAWSTLRLYLNDTLVATGKAGPDGRIAFTIGRGVSPGGYQIRIDQVEPGSGRVAHRAQVAFAFPHIPAAGPAAKLAAREEPAPQPQASAWPVAPPPPPIPERPKAQEPLAGTAPKPAETAARAAAATPPAPAVEARAAARRPEPASPPVKAAEPVASVEKPQPSEGRAVARLAEAPSGLTTTWVQPPRQPSAEPARRPAAETAAVASGANKLEAASPSLETDRRAAEALAPVLPPAARPEPQPKEPPAPAARAEPAPSRPDQGLSSTVPAPTDEPGQPGAVFVPEISTAKITRGDSLWVISKRTYGRGLRYTVIFDANQDQIKDPDLIYPGQIFVLPKDAPGGPGAQRG